MGASPLERPPLLIVDRKRAIHEANKLEQWADGLQSMFGAEVGVVRDLRQAVEFLRVLAK